MRGWWLPLLAALVACGDDNNGTGPGTPPESPNTLSSVGLDGAVALTWSDNPFQADPGLFQNYRVYTTSYDLDNDLCGTDWQLEGTTVAPEFVVGALENGVSRCFSVTAFSADEQQELTTKCTRPGTELSPKVLDECDQLDAQLRFYDPAKAPVDRVLDENTLKNADTVNSLMRISFNKMQHDIETQLPTIRVPTLIIHGDFDPIPLKSSEYLHEQIPESKIVVFTEAGHFPFIEQPEQFVEALRNFLGN